MRRTRRVVRLLLLILGIFATNPSGLLASDDVTMSVGVEGISNSDGTLQLSIELTGFTLGAKIYSEPSHRLMLAALSPDFEKSERGKAVLVEAAGSRGVVVTTDTRMAAPRVNVPARDTKDERVSVWQISEEAEVVIADAKVAGEKFSFSTALTNGLWDHCCNWPGQCGQYCTECDDAKFTCCICTQPQCGWVQCP